MVCFLTGTSFNPLLLTQLYSQSTNNYWNNWIRKSTYQGSWKEAVHRSALALKLLIFEPTGTHTVCFRPVFDLFRHVPFGFCSLALMSVGAVVASPTFSLPEYIGGTRNWYAVPSPDSFITHLLLIGTTGMHTFSVSRDSGLCRTTHTGPRGFVTLHSHYML